ncbi:MAG: plasmid stabilization protein [Anaerolinea sp.]|nr:plasmid stabilization protein [Anaerolinea sp.]
MLHHYGFHEGAEEELDSATLWYFERSEQAGQAFADAVTATIRLIIEHPDAGRPLGAGLRLARVSGFPFQLAYRVRDDELRILAFAHASRDPHYWRTRLQSQRPPTSPTVGLLKQPTPRRCAVATSLPMPRQAV